MVRDACTCVTIFTANLTQSSQVLCFGHREGMKEPPVCILQVNVPSKRLFDAVILESSSCIMLPNTKACQAN